MYKIGFIGCGHMGEAMLNGILSSGWVTKGDVIVSTKTPANTDRLKNKYGIKIAYNNLELAKESQIIVLAVNPNLYLEIIQEIKTALVDAHLLISITPSFSLAQLAHLVNHRCHVVRAMPNTPAMVGAGMTGISFIKEETLENKALVFGLFQSFGEVIEIDEPMMKVVSTLSGSGPAFVDVLMKSFIDYGISQGLDEIRARKLVIETFIGAAILAKNSGESIDTLIGNVCSPGGSTIEGVRALEAIKIHDQIQQAIDRTTQRFIEMTLEVEKKSKNS